MLPMLKIKPSDEVVAKIVSQYMRNAITQQCNEYIDDIINDRMALYLCPLHGFLIISVQTPIDPAYEKNKILFIHGIEGKGMYNSEGIASLIHLAKMEGCTSIMSTTIRPGVVRLQMRIGFDLVNFNELSGMFTTRKVVE